jgi:hypothetical protein
MVTKKTPGKVSMVTKVSFGTEVTIERKVTMVTLGKVRLGYDRLG